MQATAIRVILLALAISILTAETAVAGRPPSPVEHEAISAAVRGANSHLDVTIVSVVVSTVDAHYAKAKSEASLEDGTPIGPATTVLRGSGSSWIVLDSGSDLGGCSEVAALGVPLLAIDDLTLTRGRCAAAPPPRLATGLGTLRIKPATIVGWTPSNTGVLGAPAGKANRSRTFGKIVWKSWGRTSATGTAGVWVNDCRPDCATGTWRIVSTTTVRASVPRSGKFMRLTFKTRGGVQSLTFSPGGGTTWD